MDASASVFHKYRKVFEIGLQNTFVYRWNFLLRAIFSVVPLLGTVFIWRALFDERGSSIGGYEYRVDDLLFPDDHPRG
jgi:ABC-2 type transport system permease protein